MGGRARRRAGRQSKSCPYISASSRRRRLATAAAMLITGARRAPGTGQSGRRSAPRAERPLNIGRGAIYSMPAPCSLARCGPCPGRVTLRFSLDRGWGALDGLGAPGHRGLGPRSARSWRRPRPSPDPREPRPTSRRDPMAPTMLRADVAAGVVVVMTQVPGLARPDRLTAPSAGDSAGRHEGREALAEAPDARRRIGGPQPASQRFGRGEGNGMAGERRSGPHFWTRHPRPLRRRDQRRDRLPAAAEKRARRDLLLARSRCQSSPRVAPASRRGTVLSLHADDMR